MLHINLCHNMYHSEDTAHSKLNYLDLTFNGHPRSKVMRSTKRPYMAYYMCVHLNFGYNMHHFWDIGANTCRSKKPKFDISDLQNDL